MATVSGLFVGRGTFCLKPNVAGRDGWRPQVASRLRMARLLGISPSWS